MKDEWDLNTIINTFEELKKYVYVIDRGTLGKIVINFKDENFFHLLGLHKMNLDIYFPKELKSKSKKYKYIKSKAQKFNSVLSDQIKEKSLLQYRISSFKNIIDLLNGHNISFYEFREKIYGSQYNGDYGILKIYENVNCLLGLKIESFLNEITKCIPNSWMASNRSNKLVELKRPSYIKSINAIPIELYNEEYLTE